MRLRILLPKVNLEAITAPSRCAYAGCGGRAFHFRRACGQAPASYRLAGGASLSVLAGVKTPAFGGDLTSVKCKGEWLPLGITADSISGLALTIDALPAEDIKARKRVD